MASHLQPRLHRDDLIVYCPDQLGPSTARVLPSSIRQVTFPRLDPPQFVDWTDYAERNAAASARRFARQVSGLAGAGRLWLVWSPGYRTLGKQCESVINALGELRTPDDAVMAFDGPDGDTVEVRRFEP